MLPRRLAFCLLSLAFFLLLHPAHAKDLEDLSIFDVATLERLKKSLEEQTALLTDVCAELEASIKSSRETIKKETAEIAKEVHGVEYERKMQEEEEKDALATKARVEELQRMLANVTAENEALRGQLEDADLEVEKAHAAEDEVKRLYEDPTLAKVLREEIEAWDDPVAKSLLKKTLTKLLPSARKTLSKATEYHAKVKRAAPLVAFLTLVVVYGFVGLQIVFAARLLRAARHIITVPKALLLGDACLASFWMLLLLGSVMVGHDPLVTLHDGSDALFMGLQVGLAAGFMALFALRIVSFVVRPGAASFGEVFLALVVGHHYRLSVWQPSLTDRHFAGSPAQYLSYVVAFCALGMMRMGELKIRGEPMSVVRVVEMVQNVARSGRDGSLR